MGLIKFYNTNDWTESVGERLEITKSAGRITQLNFSKDGTILTVTTANGYFFGFLTQVPSICSAFDNFAALLSSLTEISVVDCVKNNMIVAKTNLEIEPSFISLGSYHFAAGVNSSVYYYRWRQPGLEGKLQIV
jgi:cytosine/uracil/thiamine/allantoin permease